jgi:hypothetical protein
MMRIRRTTQAAACTALATLFPDAHAARPMITDDARIVDPKACQVETWVKRNRDSTEFWALPACNPTGDAEITIGGGRVREEGESHLTDAIVQAKTILRPLETNGWGVGLAVGMDRHPQRPEADSWPGDTYFYVPLSASFYDDAWVAHLNAGAVHHRGGDNQGTWGFGNEIRLGESAFFIPEIYGNDRGRPFYQLGVRYWIIRDRLQVDATFGNRLDSNTEQRWFSIGLRILSPPFLP